MHASYHCYQQRRTALCAAARPTFQRGDGFIILFAGYAGARHPFWQDSTFYYFTGIKEPGLVLFMTLDGETTLYVPAYAQDRSQWIHTPHPLVPEHAADYGLSKIAYLGEPVAGYEPTCLFDAAAHRALHQDIAEFFKKHPDAQIGVAEQRESSNFRSQRAPWERWLWLRPDLFSADRAIDIAAPVSALRRKKSSDEIDTIRQAIAITAAAHRAARTNIAPEVRESFVEAMHDLMVRASGAASAFPTIVAGGGNAAILHYHAEINTQLADGELVLIDSGASWEGYAADISRTYAVNGTYTDRQRELYQTVLGVQEKIQDLARPGMYLSSREFPARSLHHLAVAEFEKEGLSRFFAHGIGHFLGLDVHDVGDRSQPLAEGDVITIEPGLYIPEERLGIRIEDNFLITADGAECLSAEIPKAI